MPIELPHHDKAEGDPIAHHPKRDILEWLFMGIGILLKWAGWLAAIFFGYLTLGGLVSNRLFGWVAAIYCFPAFLISVGAAALGRSILRSLEAPLSEGKNHHDQ